MSAVIQNGDRHRPAVLACFLLSRTTDGRAVVHVQRWSVLHSVSSPWPTLRGRSHYRDGAEDTGASRSATTAWRRLATGRLGTPAVLHLVRAFLQELTRRAAADRANRGTPAVLHLVRAFLQELTRGTRLKPGRTGELLQFCT